MIAIQRGKEILNLKLNKRQAAKYFDVGISAISYNLKTIKKHDIVLYNQLIEHFNSINKQLKVNTKYYQLAKYAIDNNSTIYEAAEKIYVDKNYASTCMQYLKSKFPEMYQKIKNNHQNLNNNQRKDHLLKIANYIILNDCCIEEVSTKFQYKKRTILDSLKELKFFNSDLVFLCEEILKRNKFKYKKPKYIQLAEYIVEHKCCIAEACRKFNISKNTSSINIHIYLKNNNLELYNQVLKIRDQYWKH